MSGSLLAQLPRYRRRDERCIARTETLELARTRTPELSPAAGQHNPLPVPPQNPAARCVGSTADLAGADATVSAPAFLIDEILRRNPEILIVAAREIYGGEPCTE